MESIRRSGTGAATQTHMSAGANWDIKIQITKTTTVATGDKQSLRGKKKSMFVRWRVAWMMVEVTPYSK